MSADRLKGIDTRVKHWRLEKRDATTGEVFEIVEGGDGRPTKVVLRRPGQPPESYAKVQE